MFRVLFGTQDTNWYRPTEYPHHSYYALDAAWKWLAVLNSHHTIRESYMSKLWHILPRLDWNCWGSGMIMMTHKRCKGGYKVTIKKDICVCTHIGV